MKERTFEKQLTALIVIFVMGIAMLMCGYGQKSFDYTMSADGTLNGMTEYSPHITLPRGTYDVKLSGSGNVQFVTADGSLLAQGSCGENLELKLSKDESDIIILGSLGGSVSKAEVSKDGMIYSDLIFLTAMFVLAAAYLAYRRLGRKGMTERENTFVLLAAIVLLASYPAFTGTVYFGHDLNFHLYRVEGIKDGLLSGQFPVRVHPTHNNGYGYITASVYPELFLYFPAILRILGASPVFAYNVFLLGINALTAFIMYYSAKGISSSRYAGITASAIYTLSTWRAMNLYYRAALGESLAMTFFPLIIYGLFLLLKKDEDPARGKGRWILALGFTGVLQSHVISTVFAVILIIVFILIFFKSFARKKCVIGFAEAGAFTIILNLWYLSAFLTYYLGLDMNIKHVAENTEFFRNAIIPAELFNIANTSFGYSQLLPNGIRGDMSFSLGLGVSAAMVIATAYFVFRKKPKFENEGFILASLSAAIVLVFMTTTLFPWERLQQSKLINAFCGTVRMPWRFLGLASSAVCISAAAVISSLLKDKRSKFIALIACVFVCGISFVTWGTAYTTQNDGVLQKGYAVSTDGAAGLDKEYYVYGTQPDKLVAGAFEETGSVNVDEYEKNGTDLTLSVSNAKSGDTIDVPLLYYKGYTAKDNNGNKLDVSEGDNHCLRIELAGSADEINIKYSGLWYFRLSEIISLLGIIAAIYAFICKKKGFGYPFLKREA